MPTVLQFRRGTTVQNNAFTGSAGEITVDSQIGTLRVHDGSTEGGNELLKIDGSNASSFSTNNLTEGSNLFYTDARVDTRFASKSTTDLTEGTNLYYTDGRVNNYLTTNSYATQSYVTTQVSNLVNSAPSTLDTLNELAAALGDDPNFATTVTNSIATKLPLAGGTMTGNILSSNGTQEIGSSGTPFQAMYATTFTGTATSAEYADLAEIYSADANYAPGVVVVIGGSAEVTICNTENDHRVAGVVTTNPAHLMNSTANYEYNCAVALTGRVPCKVTGVISKGDLLTTSTFGRAQSNNNAKPGTIIGKALEDFSGENGIINILVGKH